VASFKSVDCLLQAVALNLMCQLGGLCAAHTRKATILQGGLYVACLVEFAQQDQHTSAADTAVPPRCPAGDTAYVAFEAAAEALGLLLRMDVLTQRATALPAAFAAMRRCCLFTTALVVMITSFTSVAMPSCEHKPSVQNVACTSDACAVYTLPS
jgi:hypothetical protein